MDGLANPGSSPLFSPQDHTHPTDSTRQAALGFTPVEQAFNGNKTYLGWNGANLVAQVDSTYLGKVWTDSLCTIGSNANGWYIIEPSGLIIQGQCAANGQTSEQHWLPITFPTIFAGIVICEGAASWQGYGGGNNPTIHAAGRTNNSQFYRIAVRWNNGANAFQLADLTFSYIAIGW
jgi:hypothetical protein